MTRLTEQQIAEAWDKARLEERDAGRAYDSEFDFALYQNHLTRFADRIAALAVQEVERERDRASTMSDQYRAKWADADSRNTALRAQLATAKREAFVAGSEWYHSPKMDVHAEARSRYPATPSGETKCADVAGCDGKCCATPSPEAREVPSEVRLTVYLQDDEVRGGRSVMRFEGQPLYVKFTPADAKRIMAMARTGGTV